VTTEGCTGYYKAGETFPEGLWDQVVTAMARVEEITGKKLGGTESPLLVSVRSGAKFSMPGMMDTILNLGLNDETRAALAKLTGNERFSWDAYRRFIQLFGKSQRVLTPTNFGALLGLFEKNPSFRDDPRLSLYPGWAQKSVKEQNVMLAGLRAATFAGSLKSLKAMHDAGTKVTAGTDTTIAINLHAEIASYVDAGLTPFQALQAATVVSAQDLNLDAGTLEAGKLADIVLIQGDPRANIANTFNVRTVITNGVPYTVQQLIDQARKPQ
jgi:imidazolonepropionase-like amidohydrolase